MPNMFGGDQLDEDYAPVQHQEAIERTKQKREERAKRKQSEHFRRPDKIVSVYAGYDPDRYRNKVVLEIESTSGGQAFVLRFNPKLDSLYPKWIGEICQLFGVNHLNEVLYRNCFVLRCFEESSCPIEGLEVDGRRLTITGFMRRHGEDPGTVLEQRQSRLRNEIIELQQRTKYAENRLAKAADDYVDWESDE